MWSRVFAAQHNIHLLCTPQSTFTWSLNHWIRSVRCARHRVPDEQVYYKYDAGKLLLGCFELDAKPWGMDGIPEDFCFDALPDDFAHFEPVLNNALHVFRNLRTRASTYFNGPKVTPDDRYLLGPTPEAENLFVACGFNSIGIQSSGGAGKVLAEWMRQGKPPMDLWDVDVRGRSSSKANRISIANAPRNPWAVVDMHWPY